MKQRILQFVENLGISKRDFYRRTGISRGTLESPTGITEDIMAKFIAAYPEVNIEWLVSGNGEMKTDSTPKSNSVRDVQAHYVAGRPDAGADNDIRSRLVPLYNIETASGLISSPGNAPVAEPVDYVMIPDLPECDGAVRVRGDSMYPLLKSGDIILYKKVANLEYGILWGEMYFITLCVEGQHYISVKYIQKSDRPGYIRLAGGDTGSSREEIPLDMVCGVALIKASIRYNTMG